MAAGPTAVERFDGAIEPLKQSALARGIRAARERAGLTQRALAARVGVSPGAVAQWESGTHCPTVLKLSILADVLSTSVDSVLGRPAAPTAGTSRDAVTSEDLALLADARRLGIDLRAVVSDARQRQWLSENRDALADANTFLDRHGLWSDGRRLF